MCAQERTLRSYCVTLYDIPFSNFTVTCLPLTDLVFYLYIVIIFSDASSPHVGSSLSRSEDSAPSPDGDHSTEVDGKTKIKQITTFNRPIKKNISKMLHDQNVLGGGVGFRYNYSSLFHKKY